MEFELTKLLLSVAQTISGGAFDLRKWKREERERVALLLEDISSTLISISSSLRSGKEPIRECYEMRTYLEQFEDVVARTLDNDKAKELHEFLEIGAETWNFDWQSIRLALISDAESSTVLEKQARKVDEVAGVFVANAKLLRVK